MSRAYGLIISDVRVSEGDREQVHRIYRWPNGYGVSVISRADEVSQLAVVKWFDNGSYEFLPEATPATDGKLIKTDLSFEEVGKIMKKVQELPDTVLAIKWALAEEAERDQ